MKHPARWLRFLCFALLSLLLASPAAAQQDLLDQFEEKVTTFTLDNGLTFVVIERHDAPVVSFHTLANVGSVNEEAGQTGLAHVFEHMAFKGTTSIGTKDIAAEKKAIAREEKIFQQLRRERAKGAQADTAVINRLEEDLRAAIDSSKTYLQEGEFENILERAGVTGLNAYTSSDYTGFIYSLPANKLELFFLLESDRFLNPVLREFYTERDVVMEERRQRVESSPVGRLLEEFLATAFKAHPYGEPVIGHMSDLQNLSREEARTFFDTYYAANNLTIGIAGDVDPQEARRLAEKYFGRLPKKEAPMPVTTEEPEQLGTRRVTLTEPTQPYVLIGYHRPSMESEDAAVYDVLSDVLSRGRTSRFHDNLVEEGLALDASALPSYPGSKYPTLFALFGVPSRDVSPDSLEAALYAQLDRIKEEGITPEELARAKTRARDDLIGSLDSNSGLARRFSRAEALTGTWRDVFDDLQEIEAVTQEDVQRVAHETFTEQNRTVGVIQSEKGGGGAEETASAR